MSVSVCGIGVYERARTNGWWCGGTVVGGIPER